MEKERLLMIVLYMCRRSVKSLQWREREREDTGMFDFVCTVHYTLHTLMKNISCTYWMFRGAAVEDCQWQTTYQPGKCV